MRLALRASVSGGDGVEQVPWSYLEPARQTQDRGETRLECPAFHANDGGRMNVNCVSEGILSASSFVT